MRASILFVIGVFAASVFAADAVPLKIQGQTWVEYGRIVQSTDSIQSNGTTIIDLNGSPLQSLGAQVTLTADLADNLEGGFGFGAYRVTNSIGTNVNGNQPKFDAISFYRSFITQARMTYFQGEKNAPWLSFTLGDFSYNYNPDVKNLGLYLLRGPVYPGILMGGFQDFSADSTKANELGIKVHHSWGNFSHDLILLNEKDLPPTFDWSLAYVAKYTAFNALVIGGGVNFYRLIPYNSALETVRNPEPAGDTVAYSNQGTKLTAMFSVDFKSWFPISGAPNDLKLYGEAAVLGVKNYGSYYNDIARRIPVMGGFNFPTFGLLDYFSLEVEYYASPYRNDLANIGNLNAVADWTDEDRPKPSPVPVVYADSLRDNLKWSVFLEKTVQKHVTFIAQVANDHFRPRPIATGDIKAAGGTAEAFTTPKDWYFMLRMGYFF
jgi:hypothetical protein